MPQFLFCCDVTAGRYDGIRPIGKVVDLIEKLANVHFQGMGQ